jgi:hypothetical protein
VKACTLFMSTCGLKQCFFRKALGFLCLLLFLLTAQANCATYKTDSGGPRKLTEQESWILGQIRQGKEADLRTRVAGEKENYSLDAGFLEQLFNDNCKNMQNCNKGVNIANAIIDGNLDLNNVEINYPVCLKNCLFKGRVTLKKSYFKKDLSLEGSIFLKRADFAGIKIDGDCICDGAQFEDESLWSNAKIGMGFQARRAEFRSKGAYADFYSLKVVDNINVTDARFHGPVFFSHASIGRQFFADDAQFLNPEQLVDFTGTTIGNTIFLRKAKFYGPVRFKLSQIGMNFRANRAKFLNKNQPIDFSFMKVSHKVMMDDTLFHGDFNLSYGNIYDLEIRGAQKTEKDGHDKNVSSPSINLKGAVVQRNLTLANLSFDELDASQIKVKGITSIENVQINKSANFRGSSFQTLDFEKIKWPEVDQQHPQNDSKKLRKRGERGFRYEVYLGDITFSSLRIDKPQCDADANPCNYDYTNADFNRIIDFVDACPFYTQSYVQVETFFKRIGRDSWANEVFMRMNNRDLAEKRQWYDPLRWLEWFFWGKIAGYGRSPWIFYLATAFIILGAYLFDPIFLIEKRISYEGRSYKSLAVRFFISLDRFLPIDLGLAKHWDPKNCHFLVGLYFFLQQTIGWILVPIALASIYSQIK